MIQSTLCYILRGDDVLMLHRVKKKNDINKDKWIGIGGKFEPEESPDECLLREAAEETGLTLTQWKCRGILTFLNDCCEGEYIYLFTADPNMPWTLDGEREDGHGEIRVVNNHLAYRLVQKRRD